MGSLRIRGVRVRRNPLTLGLIQWPFMEQAVEEDWIRDFEAAARRPLRERLRYAFIHTYKPVLDDQPYRSFDSMEEYRRWCEENLPSWLGYGRSV